MKDNARLNSPTSVFSNFLSQFESLFRSGIDQRSRESIRVRYCECQRGVVRSSKVEAALEESVDCTS
jgi:hypothetical protein